LVWEGDPGVEDEQRDDPVDGFIAVLLSIEILYINHGAAFTQWGSK